MTSLTDAVAGPDAISLDQLLERADLQTRSTNKYIVNGDIVEEMIAASESDLAMLQIDDQRVIAYETVYFDTPDHALFLDTAYRRPKRFKVRTRHYEHGRSAMLEIKEKNGRGATVKHRRDYPFEQRHELLAEAQAWIAEIVSFDRIDLLQPTLVTRFGRATAIHRDVDERFTFDTGLVCETPDGAISVLDGIIVETKSTSGSSTLDRWLWRRGVRPMNVSKYCTGLASIDPTLPANHWHRTLRSHFAA